MGAAEGNLRLAVVDVGNSRLTMAVCDAAVHLPAPGASWPGSAAGLPAPRPELEVQHTRGHVPTGKPPADLLAEAVENVAADACVLVSVVPDLTERIVGRLPDVAVIDHTLKMPFTWGMEDPSQVGPDRLANMALACAWGLEGALVVDAGTATTFDLLDGGVFRGGLIAPGMAFAAAKLGEYAARLAPVPFGPCPLEVGTDTAGAMAAGAWHTSFFGVNGTIEALLDVYGPRPVILTGGLGRMLDIPDTHTDPAWTLRGAAWLYLYQG